MEIMVGDKKIMTPSKTIDKKGSVDEINEIGIKIDEDQIISAMNGTKGPLDKLPSKFSNNAINVVIPEYQSIGFKQDEILESMESRIHPVSDMIVVPRWSAILSRNKEGNLIEDLIEHSKIYIEEVRRINGKIIMGNIPLAIPESVIYKLFDFYLNEGITSFVLDYGTCLALNKANIVVSIQKRLRDAGAYENSILYSTNVRRTHKSSGLYPADDLLVFSQGIDIMGNLHMGGGNNKNRIDPKYKEFDSSQYVYLEKPSISPRELDEMKVRNCRLQNEEARKIINEISENGTAYNMVKNKAGATEYIGPRQTTLDFGFKVSKNSTF